MALTHVGTQPIHTERLLLRPFTLADNASMRAHWVSDPAVQHMYSEPVYRTEDEVFALLEKYIGAYAQSTTYRWAIAQSDAPDVCIGQIAYFLVDDKNHFGEIEYCIGQAFQNQGFVTEAVQAIVQFGFGSVHFHKVQVCHKQNNPASRRVIEKCGFVYEGMLRDYFFMDGAYVGRLYYSLLHSEWTALQG